MAEPFDRKLYLGPRLRVLRRELGINQTRMAEELGVSPSYLNHLERNQRPLTAQMLLRLANTYDIDIRDFVASTGDGAATELGEILSDTLVRDIGVARDEVLEVAENYPGVAEAVARFYRALVDLRRIPDRLRAADAPGAPVHAPLDWLREMIAQRGNYFAEIDAGAEVMALEMSEDPALLHADICARLKQNHGISVRIAPEDVLAGTLHHYDMHRRRLLLSDRLAAPGRLFGIARQLCGQELAELIAASIARAAPPDEDSRRLAQIALTNYAAAALLMPYDRFRLAAEQSRYDLPLLKARFGVSMEQLAHRLTSMGRTGARGVPFFMVKIDRAGTISKRFDGDAYPFARFGGTCPRWDVHATFSTPGIILPQLIETPDSRRYFTLSFSLADHAYPGARSRSAIGLGCEAKHAARLIHADSMGSEQGEATSIGPACHLCERRACPDRALPPVTRSLDLHGYERRATPYPFRRV